VKAFPQRRQMYFLRCPIMAVKAEQLIGVTQAGSDLAQYRV